MVGVRPASVGVMMPRQNPYRHIAQMHVQFRRVGMEGQRADVAEDREDRDREERPVYPSVCATNVGHKSYKQARALVKRRGITSSQPVVRNYYRRTSLDELNIT
jgi:hypothetical protein